MSLYAIRDAIQAIGLELRAAGEEADKAAGKIREKNEATASAGMTKGSAGGSMGADSGGTSTTDAALRAAAGKLMGAAKR